MAKFQPMDLLKSLSGKLCQHSDISFVERNGTKYTQKRCNARTTPPSALEMTNRTKFATARAAVAALSSTDIDAYTEAYKKNKQGYKTLQGYIFAQEYAKL